MISVSIIIPAFNEAKSLLALYKEIVQVCELNKFIYEIIIVDDGSTDNTLETLSNVHPLKIIKLNKRSGQTMAMDIGIKFAKYQYLVTLDGDGQNDPADIPKMLNFLIDKQVDVVSGWRKNRKDALNKKLMSYFARQLRWLLIKDNVHDSGCTLKVYKRECFDGISLYSELHRFIPALLKIRGFKIAEIPVNHRPRIYGKTKYTPFRIIKGSLDLLSLWFWSKYAARPLHVFGATGGFLLLISLAFFVETMRRFFLGGEVYILGVATVILFIFGVQLFILAFFADAFAKKSGSANDTALAAEVIDNL